LGSFLDIDWSGLFSLSLPLLELLLRGSVIYLALVLMFRIILKRETSSVSLTDLLVIVLIASAVESGISGGYTSITDALVLVGTILAWDFILDWLSFNVPAFRKIITPSTVKLMDRGRYLYRNMRREYITEEELRSQIRKNGLESPAQVKAAYMESDGRISIIPFDGERFSKEKEEKHPHE
jgi:uncharacterized membrane protein YcaP (DUF421 family)